MTLGMFDGVHRGHQALLRECRRHADERGLPAVALTYEPHPSRILRPEQPVRLLTTLPEKLALLEAQGMDITVVTEFTHAFSLLTPDAFLCELSATLHPQIVVAGYRTTFGHGRAGTAAILAELGDVFGFEVEIVAPVLIAGEPVSSTRIRRALDEGDVALAATLLGYPYAMTGVVTPGDGRGRTLGIPTANLLAPPEKLVPGDGIYVVDARVHDTTYRAVMSVGVRPTFDRPYALEVHLLDFDGDLYALPLTVTYLARLRDVVTFPSVDTLVAQIRADITQARAWVPTNL